MGIISNTDPAAFPLNDDKDRDAINKLEYLLNQKRAKSEAAKSDKFPNIDGRITMSTESAVPSGELQIQVKTLQYETDAYAKQQCTKQFLSYCLQNLNTPVIMIVVSKNEDKAYWIHISQSLLKNLDDAITGASVNVDIPKCNLISKTELGYIDAWQKIINQTRKIYTDYIDISKAYEQIKEQFEAVSNSAKEVELETDETVTKELQIYLDSINHIWDSEFNTLKEIIYPGVWKFGVGYSLYEKDDLVSTSYPILYGKNILPILKFKDSDALSESLFTRMSYQHQNPIKDNPLKFAYEHVEQDVMKFLNAGLIIANTKIIAREYIFAFINEFYLMMGIELQEQYDLDFLRHAVDISLYENVHRIISQNPMLVRNGIFNMDRIKLNLTDDQVKACLKTGFVENKHISINSLHFDIRIALRFINYLKSQGDQTIELLYPFKDRPKAGLALSKSDLYSTESMQKRKLACLSNLYEAYSDIMEYFFAGINPPISLFGQSGDLTIIVLAPEKKETFEYYNFQTEGSDNRFDLRIIERSENPALDFKNIDNIIKDGIVINGLKRKFKGAGSYNFNFLDNRTPLIKLVNDQVKSTLEHFFKTVAE